MHVRMLATLSLVAGLSWVAPGFADDDAKDAPAPDAPKPDTTKPETGKEKKGKAGKPGNLAIFKVIAEHADELKITPDEKEKLEKLKTESEAAVEKLKSDPDIVALQAQIKEAKGDKDKEKPLHKQLRDLMDKKGGDPAQAAMKSVEAILTPDQFVKVKEFQKEGHADKKTADKKSDKKDDAAGDKKDAAATTPAAPAPAEKAPETAVKTDAAPGAGDGMGMDK